jgi:glutathione S-transferase
MAFLKNRVDAAYGVVDKHLAAQPYLVGRAPTIADFSLSGYRFYPVEESGYEIAERFPNIAAWVERLKAVPGWASPYDVLPGTRIPPKW